MKINNYLLGFVGLLSLLTVSYFFIVFKYFQILIHHSIYYCQEMVKALNLHLPGDLGKVVMGTLLFITMFTLFTVMRSIIAMYSFKQTLEKTKNSNYPGLGTILEKLSLTGKVIVMDRSKPQAFCFGITNPKIYVSTGMIRLMNMNELEAILRHEKSHLRHKDALTLFLASMIQSLFPFFPVISDFVRIYRTDREINADSEAIEGMTENTSITEVLKKLLRYEPMPHLAFIPDIISEESLEARIHSLHASNRRHNKISLRNLGLSAISFLILIGLIVTPVRAIEIHEAGGDAVVLCSDNADNCEMVCRQRALLDIQSHMSQQTFKNFSSQY
jgi:beta-lactamase regulating signal transducer with metallopeptidase domain